jgi:ketosteroid isomerase-like protein
MAVRAAKDETKALLETDRAFDRATSKDGVQGWLSYCAEDGMLLPAGGGFVVGLEAIRKYLTPRFETQGVSLRWEPIDAYVSGDLGYTYGISKATKPGPDGQLVASYGKYVTIWKRRRGGEWRLVLDIGNSSPAPAPKPE